MKTETPIHIGSLIRAELTREGRSIVWLADQLGIQRSNCYRIVRAQSLQTDLLYRICRVMQHDFFGHYSKALKNKQSQ